MRGGVDSTLGMNMLKINCYPLIGYLEQIELSGEDEMFEISEKAGEMIKDAFKEKEEIPSIRIVYNEGG